MSPPSGRLQSSRSKTPLVRLTPPPETTLRDLPADVLQGIATHLPPKDVVRWLRADLPATRALNAPGRVQQYIKARAPRNAIPVETLDLEAARGRLRVLRALQAGEEFGAWQHKTAVRDHLASFFPYFVGTKAWVKCDAVMAYREDGRRDYTLGFKRRAAPHETRVFLGARERLYQRCPLKSETCMVGVEVDVGWHWHLHEVGDKGLLFACWPSGRVRAWLLTARDEHSGAVGCEVLYDGHVPPGTCAPLWREDTIVAVMGRASTSQLDVYCPPAREAGVASLATGTVTQSQ